MKAALLLATLLFATSVQAEGIAWVMQRGLHVKAPQLFGVERRSFGTQGIFGVPRTNLSRSLRGGASGTQRGLFGSFKNRSLIGVGRRVSGFKSSRPFRVRR